VQDEDILHHSQLYSTTVWSEDKPIY